MVPKVMAWAALSLCCICSWNVLKQYGNAKISPSPLWVQAPPLNQNKSNGRAVSIKKLHYIISNLMSGHRNLLGFLLDHGDPVNNNNKNGQSLSSFYSDWLQMPKNKMVSVSSNFSVSSKCSLFQLLLFPKIRRFQSLTSYQTWVVASVNSCQWRTQLINEFRGFQ